MTVKEVQAYYGYDWRVFVRQNGGSRRSWFRWQAEGFVPFGSQLKLQEITDGQLRAHPNHCSRKSAKWATIGMAK